MLNWNYHFPLSPPYRAVLFRIINIFNVILDSNIGGTGISEALVVLFCRIANKWRKPKHNYDKMKTARKLWEERQMADFMAIIFWFENGGRWHIDEDDGPLILWSLDDRILFYVDLYSSELPRPNFLNVFGNF